MSAYALVAVAVSPGGPEGQIGIFATRDQAERHAEKLAGLDPHVVASDSHDPQGYTLLVVALAGHEMTPGSDRRRPTHPEIS